MSANHLWNNNPIFGTPTHGVGPTRGYRAQLEKQVGVDGARIYQLGRDVATWKIAGRLTFASLALLKAAIWTGQAAVNATPGTFTDNDGVAYQNCIVQDYKPGRIEGLNGGATCLIEATVIWLSPTE